jgi:hypothetical protein
MATRLSFTSTNPKMSGKAIKSYEKGGMVTESDEPSRANVSGGGGSIKDGVAGGGRVGYRFDAGKDSDVTVGVSGSGVSTKDYKDVKATGADVTYRKKGTSVGVEVSRGRFTPSFDGNPTTGTFDPNDRRVTFKFKKEF